MSALAQTPEGASRFVAERLLSTVREDIGRADTKASILLSAALALPALLAGGHPAHGPAGVPGLVLLTVGGLLWFLGGAALVRAIMPRTRTLRGGDGLTYFGDLLRPGASLEELAARVAAAGRDQVGWLLVQSVDVSAILAAKYHWIRLGVALLTPGAALATVGLLL